MREVFSEADRVVAVTDFIHPVADILAEFPIDIIRGTRSAKRPYAARLDDLLLVAFKADDRGLAVIQDQGNERRYDSRPLVKSGRKFTFGSQVRDNMFWSCASGVTVWTAYEALMMWALANGYAPMLIVPSSLPWLILLILLLPAWETFHFFMIHRLIHWPPLYKRIHALHHRNTNIGPWSGLSMHPIEHLIYLGTVLIHWVVPSARLLIIFHLQYFTLSAATTHTGYQGVMAGNRLVLPLGTFHHQMHHRYFECNYGGLEIPMDEWTGSFHDGTAQSHEQFLDRRRRKVTA